MAKVADKRVVGAKPSSIAMFEGTFGAVIGMFIAIMYSLNTTIDVADSTNSVLKGLTFGIATGVVSLIVVPLIYFGIGWVIGYVHGWIFNVIAQSSGGLVFKVED